MRICKNPTCKKPFERNHKKQIYCSNKCRLSAWLQRKSKQKADPNKLIERFSVLPEEPSVSMETLEELDREWGQGNARADQPG